MRNHKNDDLLHTGHPHKRVIEQEFVPEIQPNDQAPRWANILSYQMALLIKEVQKMRQSTSDVVSAVNDLVANQAKIDQAIDDLAVAQSDDDSNALEAAVSQLVNLKTDQNTHLAKLVQAVPIIVAAPADPTAVSVAQPAAKQGQ